ncbi:MAG: hypothetical protein Q8P80_02690 [Candidatus Levybacteria bacterium]|nr:hypothetical protein [Candidatus Levybacteria bacterium]
MEKLCIGVRRSLGNKVMHLDHKTPVFEPIRTEFGQHKKLEVKLRFGYADLFKMPEIDPKKLNGYSIHSTAEYFRATPHTIYSPDSVRDSILSAIESGDIGEAIATYERLKMVKPKWDIEIKFPSKPVKADNQEVPTYIKVESFSKDEIFKTLGFALYKDVGTGMIDTEPQKLVVAHLTKNP